MYLAFRCGQGGDTATIAAALAPRGAYGLFFFSADTLAQRDDEVRALAAAGHKIGLLLDGGTPEEREEQARLGRELLAHILRAGTDTALTADGSAPPDGWFGWNASVDGTPQGRSPSRQLQEIVRDGVHPSDCFLLLDDSAQSAELLPRILSALEDRGCQFRLAVETVLAGEQSAG